ncbi:hypothetical protein TELCIR_23849 [Teladorsagia circumcincta]|uniref:Stearoyl-CoA 9-desaturase n=1 Tax=Teladorsagia circumcincta TaxID=45464 RepID=A0A2G9T9Z4_TELCI|nr:hypothetical protein TELCIR_23849 [Teladorsagia circumcincta]
MQKVARCDQTLITNKKDHDNNDSYQITTVLYPAGYLDILQNDIIEWARDHRCHHKWTDTHADPHNTTRGFFFAHMGWLLVRKHPQIKEQGKKLDLSDLYADPVCTFQRRYLYSVLTISVMPFPISSGVHE